MESFAVYSEIFAQIFVRLFQVFYLKAVYVDLGLSFDHFCHMELVTHRFELNFSCSPSDLHLDDVQLLDRHMNLFFPFSQEFLICLETSFFKLSANPMQLAGDAVQFFKFSLFNSFE